MDGLARDPSLRDHEKVRWSLIPPGFSSRVLEIPGAAPVPGFACPILASPVDARARNPTTSLISTYPSNANTCPRAKPHTFLSLRQLPTYPHPRSTSTIPRKPIDRSYLTHTPLPRTVNPTYLPHVHHRRERSHGGFCRAWGALGRTDPDGLLQEVD